MTTEVGTVNKQVVPKLVAQILRGRGMEPEEIQKFLYSSYEDGLHDPFLLTDMSAAVDRIEKAAEADERVVVYGDYDIDGITASAVMLEVLDAVGIRAVSYIPDRFEEGYGINQEALERIQTDGANLVISVDCGITSAREAIWARDHGLDLIITDHHAVPEIIPEAIAVINPKRPGDMYPFKDLAGVGVAFKLACAVQTRLGKPLVGQEKWWLDLVALGTVCDVVPLVGENRVLASYGLRVLRRTRRLGLRALSAVGGVEAGRLTAYHLGYVLGPRMNAAGRLEHAARSLELMRTGDDARANEIAEELDELNRQRRDTQRSILAAAEEMSEQYKDEPVLVLADPGWSHGVVGIVASSLAEKWHKPVLVAQVMGESTKGSARSIAGFNMVEALRANAQLLTKFGGHFYAAGYTLPTSRLAELRAGLCDYYLSSDAASTETPEIEPDVHFNDLSGVNLPLLAELDLMEPHGSGNLRPIMEISGLEVDSLSRVGAGAKHFKLSMSDAAGRKLPAIGFGFNTRYPDLNVGQRVTAIGELNKNEWRGLETIQMVAKEIRYD